MHVFFLKIHLSCYFLASILSFDFLVSRAMRFYCLPVSIIKFFFLKSRSNLMNFVDFITFLKVASLDFLFNVFSPEENLLANCRVFCIKKADFKAPIFN